MLGIKAILLLVLFLGTNYIGVLISKKYIERVQELKEVKCALETFKTKIRYTYEPLHEIFMHIAKVSKPNIADIFRDSCENMKKDSAEKAWEEAVLNSNTNMTKEDLIILNQLGKLLGKTDVEGQLSQIELVLGFLDTQIVQAEQEKEKNAKLYKTLGMTIGLGLVIVLI